MWVIFIVRRSSQCYFNPPKRVTKYILPPGSWPLVSPSYHQTAGGGGWGAESLAHTRGMETVNMIKWSWKRKPTIKARETRYGWVTSDAPPITLDQVMLRKGEGHLASLLFLLYICLEDSFGLCVFTPVFSPSKIKFTFVTAVGVWVLILIYFKVWFKFGNCIKTFDIYFWGCFLKPNEVGVDWQAGCYGNSCHRRD